LQWRSSCAVRRCFSLSERAILLRKGFELRRKGQRAQSTATHLRTSVELPQQQSMHLARMAFKGFCALKFRAKNSEGTSDGLRPTSSPPSALSSEISSKRSLSACCISDGVPVWSVVFEPQQAPERNGRHHDPLPEPERRDFAPCCRLVGLVSRQPQESSRDWNGRSEARKGFF